LATDGIVEDVDALGEDLSERRVRDMVDVLFDCSERSVELIELRQRYVRLLMQLSNLFLKL